jgi:hypothetical protein
LLLLKPVDDCVAGIVVGAIYAVGAIYLVGIGVFVGNGLRVGSTVGVAVGFAIIFVTELEEDFIEEIVVCGDCVIVVPLTAEFEELEDPIAPMTPRKRKMPAAQRTIFFFIVILFGQNL